MNQRPVFLVAALLVVCILFGCHCNKPKGSFKLAPRRITINTEPSGATIIQQRPLNQGYITLGKTPITDLSVSVITRIEMKNMPLTDAEELLKHSGNVVVTIEKEGYETYHGTLRTDPKETVVHNIDLQPTSENQ